MSPETSLIFYVQNHPIGTFQSAVAYPSATGWHAYEPYRGTGHAILAETLGNGDKLTAWFLGDSEKHYFEIDQESFDAQRTTGQWQVHILRFENK